MTIPGKIFVDSFLPLLDCFVFGTAACRRVYPLAASQERRWQPVCQRVCSPGVIVALSQIRSWLSSPKHQKGKPECCRRVMCAWFPHASSQLSKTKSGALALLMLPVSSGRRKGKGKGKRFAVVFFFFFLPIPPKRKCAIGGFIARLVHWKCFHG